MTENCTARVAPERQVTNVRLLAVLSQSDVSTLETNMAKKQYWELLRDPRWQRKRLEILQRSDFTCEECGDGRTTLNVHHKLYRKGANPWDYDNSELVALCEQCHESFHGLSEILKGALAQLNTYDTERVLGYVRGLVARSQIEPNDLEPDKARPLETLSYELPSPEYASGFFDALWIDYVHTNLDEVVSRSPLSGGDLWATHVDHTVARSRRLRREK